MAESQDQSVSASAKQDETQSNPLEISGELTLKSIIESKDQVDMTIVGIFAEHLKELKAVVAAHPQAPERRSYNEKEVKVHNTLTTATEIISEILRLIESPQSLSGEKLIGLLDRLRFTIETPDKNVDDGSILPIPFRNLWRRTSRKLEKDIKAKLNFIVSLAGVIRINAESEAIRLQKVQDLLKAQQQQKESSETKEWESHRPERQLSFPQSPRSTSPSNSNASQPLLEGQYSKRKEAQQIRSILKTLYHSSRPYKDLEGSYGKRHKQVRHSRLDGTCEWFIRSQRFRSWFAGGSPRLLWCSGEPGIGKSTIVSLIIDRLASQSTRQHYAFYYMGNGKVQSAAGLILSLLEQLCVDGADLPPSLKSFYGRDPHHLESVPNDAILGAPTSQPSSAERSLVEQSKMGQSAGDVVVPAPIPPGHPIFSDSTSERKSIEEPKMEQSAGDVGVPTPIPPEHPIFSDSTSERKSIEEPKMGEPSTIEHQGEEGLTLDHCPTLEVLFNALKDASQETTADTVIIIDGWDESNMDSEDEFRGLFSVLKTLRWKIFITSRKPPTNPDPLYCSCFPIEKIDNAEDVREVTMKATQRTDLQKDHDFPPEAIQKIVELSQGIYLWAKLSLKMTLESSDLENVGAKTPSSYLSQIYIPQPVNTIKQALEAIGKKTGPTGELSKRAIIWIAKLKHPLSLPALLESLSIGGECQPTKVDSSVMDWCDGLVMVDEGNTCVHSAPYEIDEAAKDIWSRTYNTMVCMFASTCVKYLMLEGYAEKFGRGCRETEEELIELLAEHPFLDYAARCWAYHVRDVCEIQSSHLDAESEHDDNLEIARLSGILADNGSQTGEPEIQTLSLNNSDGDAGEKDVQNDDSDRKNVQNPSLPSWLGIQAIVERLLETPNSLLALQILLYRDKAAAPFANQWIVHKEKIKSMSRLQKAARFGLTALVNKLATNSSDLIEKDSEGSTALHEAAKEGFEDVIERLVKDDGLSVLMMNNYKKTPLHLAKARGHHRAFTILFERACAELRRDYTKFVDVEDGDEFIAYYNIHNGGISHDPKRRKEIALTNAITRSKEDVVFMLLRGGVDANCRDEADVPAVHLAIETGSLPILQLLLDNDANAEAKALNHGGESCVHLAARLGKSETVKLLLYEGADLEDVDEQGRTALFWALEGSDLQAGYEVLKVLTGNGIDVNKKDQSGQNILHKAAESGNSLALRELIWRVKDQSQKDAKGMTPLDYAHKGGHEDVERILRDWEDEA